MSAIVLSFDLTGTFPIEEACFCLSAFARSLIFSTGLLSSTLKRAKRLAFACFSLQQMLHESITTNSIFDKKKGLPHYEAGISTSQVQLKG